MSFLIRISCYFAFAVFQTLLRKAGISLGGLPTALLAGLTLWTAEKLSNLAHKSRLDKKLSRLTREEVLNNTPDSILKSCKGCMGNKQALEIYLNECVKTRKISEAYKVMLMREYSDS